MSEKSELDIMKLYLKERGYEKSVFGEYSDNQSLSFPSFLVFLQEYVTKAINAYANKWEKELPPWLVSCEEFKQHGVAPVKAYEEIIKIMALSGAALESYAELNPDMWRVDPIKDAEKWKDITCKGDL
jgi:hypothetical protein